jgi:hypothetical protein
MASITTRAGKGSPLTNAEVDDNFTNINTELGQKLSNSGGTLSGGLTLPSVTVTGPNGSGAILSSPSVVDLWTYEKGFSVTGQDTAPSGVAFSPDGARMYIIGTTGDDINEYSLSVPWDVATAAFVRVSATVGDTAPNDLFFKPDGTKVYIVGDTGDAIREFNLTTPWDVSTLTFVQSFSVAAQDTTPLGLHFSADGTKMYIVGATNDRVYQYGLGTAWDISTASFTQFFSTTAAFLTTPHSIRFNADGTKMWVLCSASDNVAEYTLGTAWDISTSVLAGRKFIAFEEQSATGLWVEPAQNKAYVVGTSSDTVFQYKTNSAGLYLDSLLNYIKAQTEFGENVYVDKQFVVRGAARFESPVVLNSTLSTASTVTMSTTTSTINIGTSQTTGTTTIGGTAQTGAITMGQSTAAQTVNIATGATANATTKTVNIGTGGVSGSTTTFTIGSTNGTSGTINGTWNFANTLQQGGSQVLHATNFNTYAPDLTGTGASGTWGISITGNAATVSSITSGQVTTALGFTPENAANKGVANGYASLDATAKVPAAQLPSYVDDVLEYANLAGFPATGETAKIYVALDTNKTYRWSGSAYVEISPSPGTTDSLLEGSTNLYFTNTRARNAVSAAAGGLSYASATGVFSLDADLDAIAALAGTSGFLKKTAANTWSLDTSTYLTGNQSITLSGDASGSGATAISVTLASVGTAGTYTKVTTDAKGRVTSGTTLSAGDIPALSYLPLSGGTLTGAVTISSNNPTPLTLARTSAANSNIAFTNTSFAAHIGLGNANGEIRVGTTNDLQGSGSIVLHAGNYTSYAPTLTGTGASGTWGISITGNAATVTNGVYTTSAVMVSRGSLGDPADWNALTTAGVYTIATNPSLTGSNNPAGYPYGTLLVTVDDSRVTQTYIRHDSANTTSVRNKFNASDWQPWATLVTSINYNSYSPTLTGGGASGTWGISITGNAATVSSITSGQVTTALGYTPYNSTNPNGYITSSSLSSYLPLNGGTLTGALTSSVAPAAINTTTPGTTNYGVVFNGASSTDNAQAITWTWSTGGGAQAGIYVQSSGAYGTKMYLATTDSFASGAKTAIAIDHGGNTNIVRGALTQGGNQVLHAGNYTSYAPSLTGSGASGTWGISITGNAATVTNGLTTSNYSSYALPLSGGTVTGAAYFQSNLGATSGALNSPPLQVYATGGNAAFMSFHRASNYAVNFGLDSDNVLRIGGWSASADRWVLDMSGNNWVASSSRAPTFYDSNDTGYYIDGASTSRLNYVVPTRIKCVNNVNNEPRWDFSAYVVEAQHWYGNNGSQTMYLGESNYINIRNTADIHGDARAPIYYDRNDTGFYCDPNGTSNLSYIQTGSVWINNGTQNNNYNENIRLFNAPNGVSVIAFSASGTGGTPTTSILGYSDRQEIRFNDSWQTRIYNGYAEASGSYRAPIFYDSNDTGYYTDPTSVSNVNALNATRIGVNPSGASNNGFGISLYAGYSSGEPAYGIMFQGRGTFGGHYGMDGSDWATYFTMNNDSTRGWIWRRAGTANVASLRADGLFMCDASVRTPIFYDSNNTGYYIDPNGSSQLSAVYANDWFRPQGQCGIYFQDYGGGWHMTDTTWIRAYNTKAVYVSNEIAATGNITAYYSDERLKTKVGEIDGALDRVKRLSGFLYVENDLARSLGYNSNERQVGVSAQQVKAVMPEAVTLAPVDIHTDPETGEISSKSGENYLTVRYERLVPLLIEAMKEQQTQIEAMLAEIKSLKEMH